MQINYCSKCRSRVSSVDLDSGKGAEVEGRIYCDSCAKELGLKAPPEPVKPIKKITTGVRRVSKSLTPSRGKRITTGPTRVPEALSNTRRLRLSAEASRQLTESALPGRRGKSSGPLIAALIAVAALLIILVAVLLVKRSSAPQPVMPPSNPAVGTGSVPEEENALEPAVAAVPQAAAAIPPYTGPDFTAGTGRESMLGNDWNRIWLADKGAWTLKGSILSGTVPPDAVAGVLKSRSEYADYEIGLAIAADTAGALEFRFREQGSLYGRIQLRRVEPGQWITVVWRLEGGELTKAEVNGRDIRGQVSRRIDVFTKKMASTGTITIAVSSLGNRPLNAVIAGIGMQRLQPAMTESPAPAELPAAVPAPALEVIPAEPAVSTGWGPAVRFDPWNSSPATRFFGDPFAREGDAIVSKGRSGQFIWPLETVSCVLEGECRFPGNVAPGMIQTAIAWPTTAAWNRAPAYLLVQMFADGTLQLKECTRSSPEKTISQLTGLWRAGEPFRFRIVFSGRRFAADINGRSVTEAVPAAAFSKGGIEIQYATDGREAPVTITGLQVSLPVEGGAGAVPPALTVKPAAADTGSAVPVASAEKAAPQPGEWQDLLKGAHLADAGWTHSERTGHEKAFTWDNARIVKPKCSQPSILANDTAFTEGDILIDFDLGGNYWEFMLHGLEPGIGSLRIGFSRTLFGRHLARITVKGTEAEVFIDGRSPGKQDGVNIASRPAKPFRNGTRFNLYVLADTAISFQGIRYRQTAVTAAPAGPVVPVVPAPVTPAPQPEAPAWISLVRGASLEAAGWGQQTDSTWGAEFALENGELVKPSAAKGSRLYKVVDFKEGTIAFDYNMTSGGYWIVNLLPEPYREGSCSLGFDRRLEGAHSVEISIKGKDAIVLIDGKANPALAIDNAFNGPLEDRLMIRFEIPNLTALRISNLRYRAPGAVPPPEVVSIPAGTAAAAQAVTMQTVFADDFEKGLPRKSTGRAGRAAVSGSKCIQAVPSRQGSDFAVEIGLVLPEPIPFAAGTVIRFNYMLENASKAGCSILAVDSEGREIEAGVLTVKYEAGKWQEWTVNVADMKTADQLAPAAGWSIREIRIRAGFPNAEKNTLLQVDDLSINAPESLP